ncbi:dihydrodipicolinate synthase [Candidatus Carsonella ruddii CS isolate Thao2000]|uniref:Dihydrodipicolinate synthase n=1 Tax=Candidatus Carsonella ruddii CS isolate Thao2000 TaxID=1202537 RepID=J7GWF9_CARRU|nr:dihydrodipicolinate synthase family protein [Candidatus Carsonella ruddii]AFP83781.1 dihydrodipicolinate synthase [Candidatus Carsonella ruddii CS isolate Thao2000]
MNNILAIVTPIKKNGKIDWNCLLYLIKFFIFNKINNFLFFGTTGENINFYKKDYFNLINYLFFLNINKYIGFYNKTIKFLIKLLFLCKKHKINFLLISPINYILPNNISIFKYYKILNKIGLPIILYFIPKRTGYKISLKLIKKIKNNYFFFGIKNSNNLKKQNLIFKKYIKCFIFSGDDYYLIENKNIKIKKTISVLNNFLPKIFNYLNNNLIFFLKKIMLDINPLYIKNILTILSLNNSNYFSLLINIKKFFFTQSQT